MPMSEGFVVTLYGVNACGKSTLSHIVGSMLREGLEQEVNVLGTDYLKGPYRFEHPDDERFRYDSYECWRRFGEPTQKHVIQGFRDYREALDPYVRTAFNFAVETKNGLVVEGVHIIPTTVMDYRDQGTDVRAILLYVSDNETHLKRFTAKAGHHSELLTTFQTNFERIRWIQDYLLEEAVRHGVTIINTCQTFGKTVESMRTAITR
ncbi:hypothetical protein HYW21_08835 [Candidatus Woesearchaeota archaeon]|nr:hypothetical protein [Candidatus Woesearchaeota archaeon]